MHALPTPSHRALRRPRSSPLLAIALVASLALVLPVAQAAAQNVFNSDCLPPIGSTYAGQFHARYADGTNVYDLTQPEHARFVPCGPPPTTGGSTTHAFSSQVTGQMSVNGGPNQPIGGNANTAVRVDWDQQIGATRYFDTEMLQLDLVAGPALLRESPTRASTGRTAITDLGGGQYRIDSFFDVFTELSVDGGQTWMPSTDQAGNPAPGRMQLPGTVAVQTVPWSRVKVLYQQP